MPGNAVIPPVSASDVEEDPFEDAKPRSMAVAGDEWIGAFSTADSGEYLSPAIPSPALEPTPPQINGRELGAAVMAQYMLRKQLERASDPLRKTLGSSIDTLSKFGYSEPIFDPNSEELRSAVQQAVRKI